MVHHVWQCVLLISLLIAALKSPNSIGIEGFTGAATMCRVALNYIFATMLASKWWRGGSRAARANGHMFHPRRSSPPLSREPLYSWIALGVTVRNEECTFRWATVGEWCPARHQIIKLELQMAESSRSKQTKQNTFCNTFCFCTTFWQSLFWNFRLFSVTEKYFSFVSIFWKFPTENWSNLCFISDLDFFVSDLLPLW